MLSKPASKYRPFANVDLPDRQWPSRTITQPPRWCSVDLRDGNQSLIDPMDGERKRRFFDLLIKSGFKEIEVAFPSASQTDFDFVRSLIEGNLIPEDVAIQVLTQSREELIRRTIESLAGAHRAIVHLYNATSEVFRRLVFNQDKAGTIALAVSGTKLIKELTDQHPETIWTYQYSPETFSFTEPEFAVEICEAVMDVWQPTPERPIILNLPATVEVSTPNVHADQIEWFCRHLTRRNCAIISLHPHNDRGTGIAAAELGLLAGADRVEGCLFGNGERTGNVDIVTMALNMYTQGVDPGLDFSDMRRVVGTVEHCNQIAVHPRHPYAGELVFTAFSGSHQDAIKKGFAARQKQNDAIWEVPYLPIDPADIGCSYEAVIRVNSQSGKGGVAWVLEQDQGLRLPRRFQIAFSRIVQEIADRTKRETTTAVIVEAFRQTYGLDGSGRFSLVDYSVSGVDKTGAPRTFTGRVEVDGQTRSITGQGNGPLSSFVDALNKNFGLHLDIVNYDEHAIGTGSGTQAAAYVECVLPDGKSVFGVGIDVDSGEASMHAVLSAANNAAGDMGVAK
ncbi:2-isopropylmalate synthase [Acidisoma cellulosilytica]|uniref:2-isopropylmalate synthase n=1 Tax=Acidisoma cellulosilyticum TaxID=2802395 RepID=A0A963YXE9_9PROT|nr:2-isopropylmalate synthase [Acidisoma cellulosilyticum]MCB8878680.1 2-isopropylmalate synthase [Acidisoma cellulosilyticum]